MVDHLHRCHLAVAAEGFANAVKDHHRLVDGVPQHRQHGGQHRERKLPLEEGKEAQDDHHVVQVGDGTRYRVLPLEPYRQVDQDADDHKRQGLQAVSRQLLPHLRANELGAPQLHLGIIRTQRGQDLLADLCRRLPLAHRQADHDVARGAEVLNLGIDIAEAAQHPTHLAQVGGLLISHFHDRAAGEFHRKMQAARDQKKHGEHKGNERDRIQKQRMLHEGDVAPDAEKFHGLATPGQSVGANQTASSA